MKNSGLSVAIKLLYLDIVKSQKKNYTPKNLIANNLPRIE